MFLSVGVFTVRNPSVPRKLAHRTPLLRMTFQEVSRLLLAKHPTQPVCSTIASLDHSYGSMTMAMTLSAYGPISVTDSQEKKIKPCKHGDGFCTSDC